MNVHKREIRRALGAALLAPVLLGACASNFGSANDERLHFASRLPAGISQAWRQGDSVWLVPSRNTLIESVVDESGQPIPIRAEGAYLRLESPSRSFTLRAGAQSGALVLPAQPASRDQR